MFTNMDTDKSGTITYEELRTGLHRLGSKLTEAEVRQLMEAVSHCRFTTFVFFSIFRIINSSKTIFLRLNLG